MLFIIFAIFIVIILCLIIKGILPNSRDHANKTSPRHMASNPAQIYYPKQEKKVENAPSQATTIETSPESQKMRDSETRVMEPSSDLPRAPHINEFYRPRRAVHIKDIVNSKFNYAPERKQIERTPILEHDNEVYRDAERLRIQKESRIAEERNRRWFAQKQFERYDKH